MSDLNKRLPSFFLDQICPTWHFGIETSDSRSSTSPSEAIWPDSYDLAISNLPKVARRESILNLDPGNVRYVALTLDEAWPPALRQDVMERMMQFFDKDGNGTIDYSEFLNTLFPVYSKSYKPVS